MRPWPPSSKTGKIVHRVSGRLYLKAADYSRYNTRSKPVLSSKHKLAGLKWPPPPVSTSTGPWRIGCMLYELTESRSKQHFVEVSVRSISDLKKKACNRGYDPQVSRVLKIAYVEDAPRSGRLPKSYHRGRRSYIGQ
jgi:hypothetical protein